MVGDTPNLAARLQGIAEPNTVVIADEHATTSRQSLRAKDLGLKDLKGIAGPVRAWAVLRASSVDSRFEAHACDRPDRPRRPRGRDGDCCFAAGAGQRAVKVRWCCSPAKQGSASHGSRPRCWNGSPAEPHTRLRYFCSPQHTDSALYPIIGQLERAAGFAHDDDPRSKLDKLDAVLAQASTSAPEAALFADLLSLPNDGRYPALELAPPQRRQRTLEALISQIAGLARQGPVLMIFEDAHWADPTSLEVLSRAVERIASIRVLLIVTFRPEFAPPWIGQSHVTALTLNRLGQREVAAMIERIVGNKLLPPSIRQDIIERTDGVPLFIEEMTRAVLEAEAEGAAGDAFQPFLRRRLPSPQAPRLADGAARPARPGQGGGADRRGDRAGVLPCPAGFGGRKPEADLRAALDRLIEAGLLFRQGVPPHATYLFKHALVQDVAYGTLLREPRRALHARIAETLESQFAEIAESRPELLAHHCTEAGLIEKAAGLWGKAGQRSLERSALVEATAQLTRALGQIATLPGTAALRREQIKLQVALRTH